MYIDCLLKILHRPPPLEKILDTILQPGNRNLDLQSPISRLLHYYNDNLSDFDLFFDDNRKLKNSYFVFTLYYYVI